MRGAILERTPAIKDLASSADRYLAGTLNKPAVQFNQFVITKEQLEQIRALRDNPFKKSNPVAAY